MVHVLGELLSVTILVPIHGLFFYSTTLIKVVYFFLFKKNFKL